MAFRRSALLPATLFVATAGKVLAKAGGGSAPWGDPPAPTDTRGESVWRVWGIPREQQPRIGDLRREGKQQFFANPDAYVQR